MGNADQFSQFVVAAAMVGLAVAKTTARIGMKESILKEWIEKILLCETSEQAMNV